MPLSCTCARTPEQAQPKVSWLVVYMSGLIFRLGNLASGAGGISNVSIKADRHAVKRKVLHAGSSPTSSRQLRAALVGLRYLSYCPRRSSTTSETSTRVKHRGRRTGRGGAWVRSLGAVHAGLGFRFCTHSAEPKYPRPLAATTSCRSEGGL